MSSAVGVRGVAEVTSDTTVAASDYLILVYSSNGPISITLPTAGLDMAFGYRIIDADGQSETNNITVKAEGGEPINRGGSDVSDATLAQNDGVWDFDPQKKAGGGNAEWTFGIVVQDHGQLQGVTADQHHAQDHWSRHKQGNADEGKVEELATASTIAGEVPQADGNGGLSMGRIDHDSDIDNISEGDHRTTEQVEDIVGALIAAASGSNISVTYDDAGDALTIDTSALNEEEVEDVVNGLLATDSNLTLTYDDAGNTLTIGLASSITVDQASVTGETLIKASRGSTSSSITAGDFVNIVDSEDEDKRDEFNASQQFVPDSTGDYLVVGIAHFGGSSGGNHVQIRLRDVDGGNTIVETNVQIPANGAEVNFSFLEELTSGTTYELQATNNDTAFDISTDTVLRIVRSLLD